MHHYAVLYVGTDVLQLKRTDVYAWNHQLILLPEAEGLRFADPMNTLSEHYELPFDEFAVLVHIAFVHSCTRIVLKQ